MHLIQSSSTTISRMSDYQGLERPNEFPLVHLFAWSVRLAPSVDNNHDEDDNLSALDLANCHHRCDSLSTLLSLWHLLLAICDSDSTYSTLEFRAKWAMKINGAQEKPTQDRVIHLISVAPSRMFTDSEWTTCSYSVRDAFHCVLSEMRFLT